MYNDHLCQANDTACWVYSMGFRAIVDDGSSCRIDDQPMEGKVPPGVNRYEPSFSPYPVTPGAPSLVDVPPGVVPGTPLPPPPWVYIPPTTGTEEPPVPPIAPVPLAGSGVSLLGAILVTAILFWVLARFADFYEKEEPRTREKNPDLPVKSCLQSSSKGS